MTAVLGGLGAAACWATALICATRSARLIGAPSTLAWVMLVGFVVAAPLTAAEGVPEDLDSRALWWLAVAGAGNVGGLLLEYGALRAGMVSIVAPVVSTEGAIAAVLAVLAGEALGLGVGLTLAVVAAGVVLASAAPSPEDAGDPRRTVLFAGGPRSHSERACTRSRASARSFPSSGPSFRRASSASSQSPSRSC